MRYCGAGERIGAESMVDCWWSHVELEKDNNSWRGLLRVNKYLFVSLQLCTKRFFTVSWMTRISSSKRFAHWIVQCLIGAPAVQSHSLSSQTAEWFTLLMIHGLQVSLLSMRDGLCFVMTFKCFLFLLRFNQFHCLTCWAWFQQIKWPTLTLKCI